ncbi:MAG: bifunctional adenosylcobinamide kinase/adenosylcobinamide-phosphate guanylyltransferase [Oscillospiraceae bacterium]|nr:bifunctional adenosylcobinamide kinase/adenosylcobinamide-phosphate guanylyltransferase [Oscillospiraceae bacterium]MBQ3560821.1 bifunctional adenosylcobinamide kinase/adenosylcobinamide-phosphate guanylyltransferase [Oscillospiraceae bacterium]
MELIIGGAFQGKTAFAKENFDISDADIFVCEKNSAPEFDKKCISHIEKFSFWCIEHGIEPADYFFEHAENIEEKIIISDDISCGVVPINKTERAWREANGRLLIKLSEKSEQVYRIFCGISQRLK